jgi:hypothetical protein
MLKNLQIKNDKGVWYILWPNMSSWFLEMTRYLSVTGLFLDGIIRIQVV